MSLKMIGVIPARYASTRFPGKPLARIKDKPMIQWTIESARKSTKLSEVIVATDHEGIRQAAEDIGCEVVMTESSLPSGTDRVFAAVNHRNCDGIINIQGDEPLTISSHIDLLCDALMDANVEMATLAHPMSLPELENRNVVKVLVNEKGHAIYFSRFPIPYSRSEPQGNVLSMRHVGMYGYRKDFLQKFCSHPPSPIEIAESLEQLRALDMGARIKVVLVNEVTHGVDTPEDLEKLENLMFSIVR